VAESYRKVVGSCFSTIVKKKASNRYRESREDAADSPAALQVAAIDSCRGVQGVGASVSLQTVIANPLDWFAELDRLSPQLPVTRATKQPKTPRRKIFE
jgi:hypothetical protein